MKINKVLNPLDILRFGANAVMLDPDVRTDLIKQFWCSGVGWLRKCHTFIRNLYNSYIQ